MKYPDVLDKALATSSSYHVNSLKLYIVDAIDKLEATLPKAYLESMNKVEYSDWLATSLANYFPATMVTHEYSKRAADAQVERRQVITDVLNYFKCAPTTNNTDKLLADNGIHAQLFYADFGNNISEEDLPICIRIYKADSLNDPDVEQIFENNHVTAKEDKVRYLVKADKLTNGRAAAYEDRYNDYILSFLYNAITR